jgi:ADP-ribose pyrophosphatase YjhB (NUDIX family)
MMKTESDVPNWLRWAREIHVIGQTGLYYAQNEFDRFRFQRLVEMAAEMISSNIGIPEKQVMAALSAQGGYVTPKVDVRGAVFKDGQILLVKEITDGLWSLPGGWADVNEAPSKMVEREVKEETGLTVVARKIVGLYEANHDREPINVFHSYKVLFLCDYLNDELCPSYETPEVNYYPLDNLPPLSTNRTRETYIMEAYKHFCDPSLPAVFD